MGYYAQIAINILILMSLAVSLNLLLGYAGRVSMAQAVLFGIGAFTAARLVLPKADASSAVAASGINYGLGWHWLPATVVAIAVTFVAALIISLPAIRLIKGEYLILLTLAFQLGGEQILSVWEGFTGGPFGVAGIPPLKIGDTSFSTLRESGTILYAGLMLVITIIVILISWGLGESPFGRLLKTIRGNETLLPSLGKNPIRPELLTFGITAAIAGGIGAFFAYSQGAMVPGNFSLDLSILVISVVVLGGTGNILGTIVGAIILGGLEPILRQVLGDEGIPWQRVIYGAALVLMMIVRPAGLIPEGALTRIRKPKVPKSFEQRVGGAQGIQFGDFTNKRLNSPEEDLSEVLVIEDIKKSFGGLSAVGGASFSLRKGQITALIGPNGAGKTTIFNMITGTLSCDSGSIKLRGRELTGMPTYEIERLGIARSFQDVRLNENMTVLDNVAVAVPNQPGEKIINLIVHPLKSRKAEKSVNQIALECLAVLGVEETAHQLVRNLSYGDQKLVAIARLLATDCDVLLLDEPTSGVDPGSVNLVIEGVSKLRDLGKTVCLVEHSVHFVERLADHAVFLDQGVVIAEGTVAELVSSAELTELYFGN